MGAISLRMPSGCSPSRGTTHMPSVAGGMAVLTVVLPMSLCLTECVLTRHQESPQSGATAPRCRSCDVATHRHGADLQIADDEFGRPAISELTVRVMNLGDTEADGQVSLDVVDSTGALLRAVPIASDDRVLRVSSYDQGGKQGKAAQVRPNVELSAVLDSLARSRATYGLRASVRTLGHDVDPSNNIKVKEWGPRKRLDAGKAKKFEYVFRNGSGQLRRARWKVEHTRAPVGWLLEGLPDTSRDIWWRPGQALHQSLIMRAVESPSLGGRLETRLTLLDAGTGEVIQQHEWFQVYDTVAPMISNYRVVVTSNGMVAIQVMVGDRHSSVSERGVSTEYSLDGGQVWQSKLHRRVFEETSRVAVFETLLGPFMPNSAIWLRINALDLAGNVNTDVPPDAHAFVLPPNAEKLISDDLTVPAREASPVFDVEKLTRLLSVIGEPRDVDPPSDREVHGALSPARSTLSPALEQRRVLDARRLRADLADKHVDMVTAIPWPLRYLRRGTGSGTALSCVELVIPK